MRSVWKHVTTHGAPSAGNWLRKLSEEVEAAVVMPAGMMLAAWAAKARAAMAGPVWWSSRTGGKPSSSMLDRAYANLERELAVRSLRT